MPQGHPPFLFGLAPGGVYRAPFLAVGAVRSYRTVSPLPDASARRSVLCGTFPGVTPARRYLAPCLSWSPDFPPSRPFGTCESGRPAA